MDPKKHLHNVDGGAEVLKRQWQRRSIRLSVVHLHEAKNASGYTRHTNWVKPALPDI